MSEIKKMLSVRMSFDPKPIGFVINALKAISNNDDFSVYGFSLPVDDLFRLKTQWNEDKTEVVGVMYPSDALLDLCARYYK